MTPGGRFSGGRFAHSTRLSLRRDPWVDYAANGFEPYIVSDFRNGAYKGATPEEVDFGALFVFSRASGGTYTDATGRIVQAAVDSPRFDHVFEGGEWVRRGILLEGQPRENKLLHSSGFDHPVWSKSRASVTANDAIAPNGVAEASRLTSTTATFDGAVRQTVSYAVGETLSFSVYAKAGDRPFLFLRERTHGFAKDSYFDLSNGVTGTINSVHTARMQDVGEGWYRCSITVTATRTAASGFEIYNSQEDLDTASTQPGFTHIWGAQLEQGPAPSSYIPTLATSVARAADSLAVRSEHFANMTGPGGVSLALVGNGAFIEDTGLINLLNWLSPSGDLIEYTIKTTEPATGQFQLSQISGGVHQTLNSPSSAIGQGQDVSFSLASRHSQTAMNAGVSGATLGSVAVSGIPDLGAAPVSLGTDFMGHLTLFRMWHDDIGNAGLQSVTG